MCHQKSQYVTYINELLVFWIVAVVGENANESLLTIESLANLVKTLHKSYIHTS